jgi:hypothetical protein
MAKPNWLILNPTTGSGNGSISNSAAAHTGRVARTGIVTVTGEGVAEPVTYKVNQSPLAEYVSFDNGTEMAAGKQAGKVTIEGKSNAAKLTFSFVGEVYDVELPTSYSAAGVSTANGVAIEGDPGAAAEYAFSIVLDFPENDTIGEVVRTVLVKSEGGKSAQIAVRQAAGDARLAVNPTEITIDQAGNAVSVNVESNTSWSVA